MKLRWLERGCVTAASTACTYAMYISQNTTVFFYLIVASACSILNLLHRLYTFTAAVNKSDCLCSVRGHRRANACALFFTLCMQCSMGERLCAKSSLKEATRSFSSSVRFFNSLCVN